MQILKEKNQRHKEFNQFVPTNPNYGEVSIERKVAMSNACKRMSTDFTDENGLTAKEAYEKRLDAKVLDFSRKYDPIFARPEYYELTIIDEDGMLKWNIDALNLFIRGGTSWIDPFVRFKKYVETALLLEYNIDISKLDSITWNKEVDIQAEKHKLIFIDKIK